ncbi:uncharacterized protein LOC130169281 [Seriola aureovittata]|uniref:uncharacterized protein LOC130169281 n=1 Tax=Seriola aureovittata TaxID=2871759 RepID=UPI0024BDDFDA|nr:uncharacterized protein LOC130169281 [Seriola aureovittata]
MSLLDAFQDCQNFTACVNQMKQDFDTFLASVDEQKIQDRLLGASEISHSYNQKLLVMTDQEKSTNDRVQQEYSMDPHYSLIVSKECLYNESCLPEADSYTVVKIFGRVSDDGQTVSGLSGSSLAELVLKPSLEAAPVFSLDGNTTRHFQYNFIRVLMVRGNKAVLETNQENHQIYQVMDQHDSVSSYRIPQRPVDHTTQYEDQQILMMQDDPAVRKAAAYLYEKHPTVSSIYVLDKNQRPKLIHGDSVPLSEDSRLVLVGHGVRDSSGEMRLAGHTAQDVAKSIAKTFRVRNTIKTIRVVACEVGSDKTFVETMLRELHKINIKTELHLSNTVIQVMHTGQKITQEVSLDGVQWRHKDDSKKVVATLDRNGNVIIRNEPGSRGEPVFTNERNVLMDENPTYRNSWPKEPRTFVDQNVYQKFDSDIYIREVAIYTLEALTWAFFKSDQPLPNKVNFNNLQQIKEKFVIKDQKEMTDTVKWIEDEQQLKDILKECYEIKSGQDVRNVIRHYAKTGEEGVTYLMVNDWIYLVNPKTLYVYPVGKKLDNNQMGKEEKINEVKGSIQIYERHHSS